MRAAMNSDLLITTRNTRLLSKCKLGSKEREVPGIQSKIRMDSGFFQDPGIKGAHLLGVPTYILPNFLKKNHAITKCKKKKVGADALLPLNRPVKKAPSDAT